MILSLSLLRKKGTLNSLIKSLLILTISYSISGPLSKTFNRKPHDPSDDKVQVRLDRRTLALDNNQIKSLSDQLDLPLPLARPSRSVSTGSHTSNVSNASNGWPKSSPNSPTFNSKNINVFSEVSKDVTPDSPPKYANTRLLNFPLYPPL